MISKSLPSVICGISKPSYVGSPKYVIVTVPSSFSTKCTKFGFVTGELLTVTFINFRTPVASFPVSPPESPPS
jgi:hypothetical protein